MKAITEVNKVRVMVEIEVELNEDGSICDWREATQEEIEFNMDDMYCLAIRNKQAAELYLAVQDLDEDSLCITDNDVLLERVVSKFEANMGEVKKLVEWVE